MTSRTWVVIIGPLLAIAIVVVVLYLTAQRRSPCSELRSHLGQVAEGPGGISAILLYDQWPEASRCGARTSVAIYAPGESWEDEALAPIAIVNLADGQLSEVRRRSAWVGWHPSGTRLAVGFGAAGSAVLYVETLPTRAQRGRFLACGTAGITLDASGRIRWPRELPAMEACRPIASR